MLSDADYLVEQREYASAAGIAISVVEVIPRNYDSVMIQVALLIESRKI